MSELKPAYMAVRGESQPRPLGLFETKEQVYTAFVEASKKLFEERAKACAQPQG